ncbi:MAG: hypothetical protein LBD31_03960, partial [Treponema sp.]|nr:hypothetical protein [Treponema sp.]
MHVLFANALITFGAAMLPLCAFSIVSLDAQERTPRRMLKRLLFVGAAGNCFLLFLFSIYKTVTNESVESIAGLFLYLCGNLSIEFLLAAAVLNVLAAGVLKYGHIDVKIG